MESMKLTVAATQAEMAGEHASCMARLLVDQVIACWIEVNYLESLAAEPAHGSVEVAGFRLKRLESAQRRYLQALKTLTTLAHARPGRPGTGSAAPVARRI